MHLVRSPPAPSHHGAGRRAGAHVPLSPIAGFDPARVTGEITYVTAVMPYFQESQPERHPIIQKIFVLAGEVAGPQGMMRSGSYVLKMVFQLPNAAGRSRHGLPVRAIHNTASTNNRASPPVRPLLCVRGLWAYPGRTAASSPTERPSG